MNDKVQTKSVQDLKKAQLQLNGQITMLQEESRRLRGEIGKAQATKNTVSTNRQSIDTAQSKISSLQKKIKTELEKLAVAAPSPAPESGTSPMAPPPPPASPPPSPPFTPKSGSLKLGKSKDNSPKKSADAKGDLFKEIRGGKTLKSGTEREAQALNQDESALYQASVHLKENEIKRLVEQINDLLDALETEKIIAQEYEEELEKQTELILELQEIETSLEEKFKKVQEEVGMELSLLEEQRALVRQEQLAEHEALIKKENDQSVELVEPPSAPPPPPPMQAPPAPTFSPVSNSFKLKVKAAKASGEVTAPDAVEATPKAELDMSKIASVARESKERRDALETKKYVAGKLIQLVAAESVAEIDEMEYSPEQEQLKSSLGETEYQRLKTEMVQRVEGGMSDLEQGAAKRRAALNRTPRELALIAGLKDKTILQETVVAFIDSLEESSLLELGKGMKQTEELAAQKVFEEQQKEEAQKREERDKELEAAKKIKAEKKAAFVKSELAKLGIKEGTVNADAVARVAAEKSARAQTAGGLEVASVTAFLESVDQDLGTKIELFKAAASQAIESAAIKPPEDDAPVMPAGEPTETTLAESNTSVVEAQTEHTDHVVLDLDEIERDLNEIDRQLAQEAVSHQLDQDLHEIEQGLNEIDQQLAREAVNRQLDQDLHEIEQGLNEIDQQLTREAVSRQLDQDLQEIEQGLNEIDQQLAHEASSQLEQDLHEIEQSLNELDQQLAKPQPKSLERVEKKLSHLVSQQDKASNSRRDLLEKSDFNTHLNEIKKVAEHFAANKQPFAAKETNILHGKLLQARDAFIKTGDANKFVMASNKALATHETRYLAQNNGALEWLKRTVKSLQERVKSIVNKPVGEEKSKQIKMQSDENTDPRANVKPKEIPVAVRSMKSALKKLQEVNTTEEPQERGDLHL